MIFNFHKNHRELVLTIFVMYALLAFFIAVVPAFVVENDNGPLPKEKDLTESERRGQAVFIANGCVACHTQQVRNIEMDKMWGSRPSIPADYFYSKERMNVWQQSPSILGSERTGPDLTNVGERLPSASWQYIHLYNPRAMVPQSIMPAFTWLFTVKAHADSARDVIVAVPDDFRKGIKGDIVATQDAKDLVAYLLSLKQTDIPKPEDFLPNPKSMMKTGTPAAAAPAAAGATDSASGAKAASGAPMADGKALFTSTCAICHQTNGEGVKGAFPPLKGSPVVGDDDATLHIKIVLEGYDARSEYSVMPPFKDRLTDDQIAAIINYERTSWGNHSKTVTVDEVAKIRAAQ
jgi:cytochrome c oxidase cbb3-type subunit 2